MKMKSNKAIVTVSSVFERYGNIDMVSFVCGSVNDPSVSSLMDQLKGATIECRLTNEWPGTVAANKYLFIKVRLCSALTLMLWKYDNVYDWIGPKLPEDLAFYAKNRLVFYSIAHERSCEWLE